MKTARISAGLCFDREMREYVLQGCAGRWQTALSRWQFSHTKACWKSKNNSQIVPKKTRTAWLDQTSEKPNLILLFVELTGRIFEKKWTNEIGRAHV